MPANARDRVTIDLRGSGPVVQQQAAAQGLTVAAFVRRTVLALAEAPSAATARCDKADRSDDGPQVKVTLRLPAAHALLLARRSRRAEVSQGSYVVGLLEGQPPAPDRREALATLSRSTDQLSIVATDLQAFLRLVGRVPNDRLEPYRAGVRSLVTRVNEHLDLACRLVADLQATTRVRSSRRPAGKPGP